MLYSGFALPVLDEHKLPCKCVADISQKQLIVLATFFLFSQRDKLNLLIRLQRVHDTIRGRAGRL